MNLEDAGDYIKANLGCAGGFDSLFSEDANGVIHRASRDHPSTVNNLVLAALMATRSAQSAIVDESAAQSAVNEFSE